MEGYEQFFAKVREVSSGMIEITIPKKVVDYAGYKHDDILKVLTKKTEPKETEENVEDVKV